MDFCGPLIHDSNCLSSLESEKQLRGQHSLSYFFMDFEKFVNNLWMYPDSLVKMVVLTNMGFCFTCASFAYVNDSHQSFTC